MNKEEKMILEYFNNNSYITTKEAEELGIKKHKLSKYVREGFIERSQRGVYVLVDDVIDVYEVFQSTSDKMIYSFGTALYFHGLSDRAPSTFYITLPQGYNASRIKKREDTNIHYVKKELHELGKEMIDSPLGGKVVVYDKERCICDLIKYKDSIDKQLFVEAITLYFKSEDADKRRLMKYAEYMKIEDKVKLYLEIL